MALLTSAQLHEIRTIIREHHTAFIINTIGPEAVAKDVVARLKAKGLIAPTITTIEDAYLYGQVLATLESKAATTLSFTDFKAHLRANPIPLSAREKRAVDIAKHRAAQYATALGERINSTIGAKVLDASKQYEAQVANIRDKVSTNIAKRESIGRLVTELKQSTKDWERDWNRIAITEKHNAMQEGVADHWQTRYGEETRVAKRPMPDACEHCKRVHLGPDGQPRIFKLSDLQANGTNVGRKSKAWMPVIGAVHPNCQCQLIRIPAGWGFDEAGALIPGGTLGKSYLDTNDFWKALLQEADLRKGAAKGQVDYQGIPIHIESRKGTYRHWGTPEGESGKTYMLYDYGEIIGTNDADEDAVDVYLGADPRSETAYIVHQLTTDGNTWDESKVFLGFGSEEAVRAAYAAHMTKPDAFGGITAMSIDQLKRWIAETGVNSGHMMKAQPRKQPSRSEQFTIPLEKATRRTGPALVGGGTVATEQGGQTSPAGNRAPGHGTMVNFMDGNVGRHPPEPNEAIIGWDPKGDDPADVEARRVYADPEDYHMALQGGEHAIQEPKEYDLETQLEAIGGHPTSAMQIDTQAVDDLRDYVSKEEERQKMRPRNYTDTKVLH